MKKEYDEWHRNNRNLWNEIYKMIDTIYKNDSTMKQFDDIEDKKAIQYVVDKLSIIYKEVPKYFLNLIYYDWI